MKKLRPICNALPPLEQFREPTQVEWDEIYRNHCPDLRYKWMVSDKRGFVRFTR